MSSNHWNVGDDVVHPVHGPGTITAIEDRDMGAGARTYLKLALDNLTVLVPAEEVETSGLRQPMDAERAQEILDMLSGKVGADPGHAARRRRNEGRLSSGQAADLARIVRSLDALKRDSGKALRERDNAHFTAARQRLADELSIAMGIDGAQALALISEALPATAPEDA